MSKIDEIIKKLEDEKHIFIAEIRLEGKKTLSDGSERFKTELYLCPKDGFSEDSMITDQRFLFNDCSMQLAMEQFLAKADSNTGIVTFGKTIFYEKTTLQDKIVARKLELLFYPCLEIAVTAFVTQGKIKKQLTIDDMHKFRSISTILQKIRYELNRKPHKNGE